jgi:hypothetical protein
MKTYNLNEFFYTELEKLKCDRDTRAYVASVLTKFKTSSADLSKESITLLYAQAKFSQDFNTFQNIGDWLLYIKAFYPEHLNNASSDYYYSIGSSSYYSCYKILNKKWKLYEQLADLFPYLSLEIRKILIREY